MKVIAGLGNPGPKFRGTRHNIGFEVVDELARRGGATFESSPAEALVAKIRPGTGFNRGDEPVLLAKPLTFMNLSGQAVQALAHFHKVEVADLLVVADDVNLPLGRLRARRGGSAGGHNGFRSVTEQLGTDQFPRLRIGVGGGEPGRDLAGHVLGRFSPDERQAILDAVNRAADAVEVFVSEGIDTVMNRFNAEPAKGLPEDDSGDVEDSQD